MATDLQEYGDKERNRLAQARRELPLDNPVRVRQETQDKRNNTGAFKRDEPSLAGFAGDVASRTFNNYREKGLIGGLGENVLGVGGAAAKAGQNIAEGAATLGSDYVLPFLFGRDATAKMLSNPETDEATPAQKATPTAKQPADANALTGELITAERESQPSVQGNVGLNAAIRPNVPDNPFNIETGIDASKLPGGAFGGLNALNAASAALMPYKHEQDRKRNAAAQRLANKPTIETIQTPDGREVPMVMDSFTGQRLDPNNIDPATGMPQPMMSRTQMLTFAQPRIDAIVGNDDFNDDAKRQRLSLINSVFADAGYEPINIDELL